MQSNGFDRKMIRGDLKKICFQIEGGTLVFSKTKIGHGGFFLEKKPMTNKIKKFLYTLEHLIPDGYDEIPTFALYHPLLIMILLVSSKASLPAPRPPSFFIAVEPPEAGGGQLQGPKNSHDYQNETF